ncbi:MAG: hypothetical protein ACRDTQ_05590 [Micromonosporaceae bacterium]
MDGGVIQSYEIGRMVLVKTSAWLLSRDEGPAFPIADKPGPDSPTGAEQLVLRPLLEAITAEGLPGRAWLCRASDEPSAPIGWCGHPDDGSALAASIDEIDREFTVKWLQTRSRTATSRTQPPRPRKEIELTELRHRVFLESTRFTALLDGACPRPQGAADLTYYVVLDLRFFHLLEQLRCHVSVAVWSAVPRHPMHRPDELADETPQMLAADVDAYRQLFDGVADAAETLLAKHGLTPVDGAVGDGVQGLPVFWVVLPDDRCLDPMDYLKQNTLLHRTTNHLAQIFLKVGDVRDYVVSHSVLNGTLLTLRRPELHEARFAVPRYLMIPGGPPAAYQESPEVLEHEIATTITTLSDLEAESASRLLAAKFDLEIWRNHLGVYDAVVERAAFLWDAVSTHLPIRRGVRLGKAHRAVELLHQMLLQGVADLGHITTLIRQDTAKVHEVADDVADQYNAKITERRHTRDTGLVTALTETGLCAHVKREAGEIATQASRVKIAYEDLLGAIAHAFDERRVREFDVLQKFNFLLGAALGSVGVVTVLDATVQMKPPEGGETVTLFGGPVVWGQFTVLASWLMGVLLIGVGSVVLSRTTLIGKLGSWRFRALYDGRSIRRWLRRPLPMAAPPLGVWQVLRDISTDSLERIAKGAWEAPPADWEAIDRRLASEYASIWDDITRLPRPHRDHRASRDIRTLSRQIEQWGMHALLLTERPRRMYRYPLPLLTCLFRTSEHIEGSFLGADYLSRVNLVAYEDLTRSLARIGFSGEEVRRIDNWLTGATYANAAESLQRISELNLRPQMSYAERQATLQHVAQRVG